MKKFGIAAFIVGLLIFSISTGAWASKTVYPKAKFPTLIITSSNFSGSFTANMADYVKGYMQKKPGKLQVGAAGTYTLRVRIDDINGIGPPYGTGQWGKAAGAFQIYADGLGWANFVYNDVDEPLGSITNHYYDDIYYRWVFAGLDVDENADKWYTYKITFYVMTP